jgi:hypothetical protein
MVEKRHRRLMLATAPQLRDGAIFSHGSAAVIHGLPVWPEAVARVHVTRSRRGKRYQALCCPSTWSAAVARQNRLH